MSKTKSPLLTFPTGTDGTEGVLLHSCCAPCSSAILECMLAHGISPTIFYCNPNIYPRAEYDHRLNEIKAFAAKQNIPFVEDEYDHEAWLSYVAGHEQEPERGRRCLLCFKYRLQRAARYALSHGFRLFTTTLASSRWKSLTQINEAGLWAASLSQTDSPTPPVFWEQNWRKGGLQERRNELLRFYNFYNQQYCGCEFSMRATTANTQESNT